MVMAPEPTHVSSVIDRHIFNRPARVGISVGCGCRCASGNTIRVKCSPAVSWIVSEFAATFFVKPDMLAIAKAWLQQAQRFGE